MVKIGSYLVSRISSGSVRLVRLFLPVRFGKTPFPNHYSSLTNMYERTGQYVGVSICVSVSGWPRQLLLVIGGCFSSLAAAFRHWRPIFVIGGWFSSLAADFRHWRLIFVIGGRFSSLAADFRHWRLIFIRDTDRQLVFLIPSSQQSG